MRRRIPEPISLAPDTIIKTKNGSGAEILEAGNMTQMVGVLQQLGLLATYSHELFADLSKECEASFTRINKLKTRLGGVTERLSRVDDALGSTGEEELAKICASNPGGEYKLQHTETNSLFTPASRPPALQATFDEARAPPPLHLLDPFVERDPAANKYHKYGLEETCLDLYSDPNFFLKQCARPLARAGGRPTDPPTTPPLLQVAGRGGGEARSPQGELLHPLSHCGLAPPRRQDHRHHFTTATIIRHLHPPLAHLHRLSLQAELKAKKAARRAAGGGGGKAATAKRKAKAIKKKRFMTEAVQLVESAVCPA